MELIGYDPERDGPLRCPACNGTGLPPVLGDRNAPFQCRDCDGTGIVSVEQYGTLMIRSITSPEPIGPPEPTVEEYPDLDAATLREHLTVHRDTWDMPALMATRPDIVNWIAARYRVDFDLASNVVLIDKRTQRPEHFSTGDVREVVATVLEREIAAAG